MKLSKTAPTLFALATVFSLSACTATTTVQTDVSTPPSMTATPSPAATTAPASASPSAQSTQVSVKSLTSGDLTLKYPSNWFVIAPNIISEKKITLGEQESGTVSNSVEIQQYSTQIAAGSTNQQLFNKISALTAPMVDGRDSITKVSSGKVASGEMYVIFKVKPSASAVAENTDMVKAYVLKGQTIYQLTLSGYNQTGLTAFEKIVSSITVK